MPFGFRRTRLPPTLRSVAFSPSQCRQPLARVPLATHGRRKTRSGMSVRCLLANSRRSEAKPPLGFQRSERSPANQKDGGARDLLVQTADTLPIQPATVPSDAFQHWFGLWRLCPQLTRSPLAPRGPQTSDASNPARFPPCVPSSGAASREPVPPTSVVRASYAKRDSASSRLCGSRPAFSRRSNNSANFSLALLFRWLA